MFPGKMFLFSKHLFFRAKEVLKRRTQRQQQPESRFMGGATVKSGDK